MSSFKSCRTENSRKKGDRFFYFFENDISKNTFFDIASFLKLKAEKTWVINVESAFVDKSNYKHYCELVKFYTELIKNRFYEYPSIIEKFFIIQLIV